MPGKHAPASSKSFLLSLATAVGGAIAALAVVVGIALVALNAGSDDETGAAPTLPSRTPSATSTPTSTPTATSTPTSQPTGRLNSPAQTSLRILNGTNRAGLARQMANRAKQEGYPEAKLGNTPRAPKSTIYYRFDGREEAEDFQRLFPELTEIAAAPASFATDVILTIVVGEDYPASSPSPTATASA